MSSFSMCEAHAVVFALAVAAAVAVVLAVVLAVAVAVAVPWRNASLQPAATWFAGLGPRRAPVSAVAGLLTRS